MSKVPEQLKYSKEHEWISVIDESTVKIGITDYAQDALGDIVFVELPEDGADLSKDAAFGTIESVKAVSDIYAPISGKISNKNSKLEDDPAVVNSDPYGDGWLIDLSDISKADLDSLMNAEQYQEFLTSL